MVVNEYSRDEKKLNGIFYTPKLISDYLSNKLVDIIIRKKKKVRSIIDPACGDAMLLRSFNQAAERLKLVKSYNIIGIDNDINAIIRSVSLFAEKQLKNLNSTFIGTDGLFPVNSKGSNEGWLDIRRQYDCERGFDVALSNPPWGADLSNYRPSLLSKTFNLARGQFDIYNLFVEVVLNNLVKGGFFGFILPDSIFSQEQHKLRALIAQNTTIHLIARLGEKIFPEINRSCVVIIGQNIKCEKEHLVDCFRLSSDYRKKVMYDGLSLEDAEKLLMHQVPQSRFLSNEDFIFDIDLRCDEETTFKKIEHNSTPLKAIVNNTRGAEISKKGLVCQCSMCNRWMPVPKAKMPRCTSCGAPVDMNQIITEKIILNHNGQGNIKIKVGEDLYRFTSITKSWLNTLKDGINYKDLKIYNGDKILVRKTGVGITASIDYESSITNQVVYILKLKPEYHQNLSLEFVLSVLNSRAMTYYLIKKFGENEWRTHPYLTQTMLVNLPFPAIDFSCNESQSLIAKITRIVKNEVKNSSEKNISKANDLIIERIVAHFFQLEENDYMKILETLGSSEQLIPIKRLLNCTTKEIFSINGI